MIPIRRQDIDWAFCQYIVRGIYFRYNVFLFEQYSKNNSYERRDNESVDKKILS